MWTVVYPCVRASFLRVAFGKVCSLEKLTAVSTAVNRLGHSEPVLAPQLSEAGRFYEHSAVRWCLWDERGHNCDTRTLSAD